MKRFCGKLFFVFILYSENSKFLWCPKIYENYDTLSFQSFASPKSDEWSRFVRTLQELRQHAAEREEDSLLAGISSPLR